MKKGMAQLHFTKDVYDGGVFLIAVMNRKAKEPKV